MNRNTDQYYIDKTMQGDTQAFGVLVERYQDFIFTVVLRMLKIREEAEEVAQDAFIKAFESLSSFRGESKFSSWLYSIAYRKALDRLRKNKKYVATELIEEITEGNLESIENALGYLEDQERKQIIQECITQLPKAEAAIITFYYFEDQSVKEVAAITGLSEDNIKIKLYRSRKKLFTLLKHFVLPEISNNNGQAI
ncbi:MAG: RNA polymerase sigma factor [Altibacter sp.]|uniref:RNA polymerase sigma factor n=1 Tax=Altibacter sp. TaxID=2024823 RepID=UPI001E104AF7|nr:RNA polymerase sigma factor [Altibacter sp.]MBZ0327847.1 RNA polymerase sigma factor [Altibacter sp.]